MTLLTFLRPLVAVSVFACFAAQLSGQTAQVPRVVPIPPLHARGPLPDPAEPAARNVEDSRDHLVFHLPNGWNLSRTDGEVSTFRLDARSVPRRSQFRMVASLGFNPYPQSTFESALFYVSSTPNSSAASCAFQTAQKASGALPPVRIDDVPFARGEAEHGKICTESRDVSYTALRGQSCLRFDLVLNSFCGGEVSGAQDLSADQFQALLSRLESILNTIHFTSAD
jgi:hypothetical protein